MAAESSGVDHLEVSSASAAVAQLPVVCHLHQLKARDCFQDISRRIEDLAISSQVAGIMISHRFIETLIELDLSLGDQPLHKLGRMEHLCVDLVFLLPCVVARRASEHDRLSAQLSDLLLVVVDQFLHLIGHSHLDQRKTTAPLLSSKGSEIHLAFIQDLNESLRNFLDEWKEGGHTSDKVEHLCLFLLIHVIRSVLDELHPCDALLIRLV